MPEQRDRSRLLKSQHAAALESVVARFEAEWEEGRPPVIDAYLAEDCPARGELLVELVHADLEYRWKTGDAAHVASYLERYPEIFEDADAVSELRKAEDSLRKRYADSPTTAINIECVSAGGKGPNGPPANSAMPEYPRLGKFELLRRVGQGAFGTVYMARDTNLDRIVAVKVPRHGRFGSKEEEERFIREARSAAQLQHPGIIPVFEVGRTDAHPFIVSEFVEGVTLNEAIYARPFSPKRAARVAARLAEALEHAHQHGVVHRDVKPSNVILQGWTVDEDSADSMASASTRAVESHDSILGSAVSGAGSDPVPRLMDFGLARRVEGSVSTTVEGVILGTPAYMSPEQARGEAYRVDGRSDIYSLGVVLYQMLTQELPFRGKLRMLLDQVLHEDPRPPRRLNDRIPRDLETITLKCLAKDPAARYQTAGELVAELERFLSGVPIQARPVSRIERAWRWCRRKPAVAASLAAAVAFLLIALTTSTVGYLGVSEALVETEEARAKSDESLRHARQAVNDLLTEVSENDLFNQPGMQPVRKKLLLRARDYYEKFLQQRQGEAALQEDLADAHFHIGLITEEIDSPREAIESYERARTIQNALLAKGEASLEHLEALGDTLNVIGRCRQKEGRFKEGMEAYSRALEIRSRLVALDPDGVESRRKLANIHMNIGLLRKEIAFAELNPRIERLRVEYQPKIDQLQAEKRGDETGPARRKEVEAEIDRLDKELAEKASPLRRRMSEAGRAEIEKAQSIRQEILAGGHDTPAVRRDLAKGVYQWTLILAEDGDTDEAESVVQNAFSNFKGLVEEDSVSIDLRYQHAMCCRVLGDAQLDKMKSLDTRANEEDRSEAEACLERALVNYGEAGDRLEALLKHNPTVTKFKIALAGIEVSRGMATERLGRDDLGLAAFAKAEGLLDSAIKEGAAGPRVRHELITALIWGANVHKEKERWAETIATLDRLQSHLAECLRETPDDPYYLQLLEGIRKEARGIRQMGSKEVSREENSGGHEAP